MERIAGSVASRTPRILAALAAAALVAFAATPVPADTPIWSIDSVSTSDSSVDVGVRNLGQGPMTGRVIVQAVVGDSPIWSSESLTVPAGGRVSVRVPFPASVRSVLSVSFQADSDKK